MARAAGQEEGEEESSDADSKITGPCLMSDLDMFPRLLQLDSIRKRETSSRVLQRWQMM